MIAESTTSPRDQRHDEIMERLWYLSRRPGGFKVSEVKAVAAEAHDWMRTLMCDLRGHEATTTTREDAPDASAGSSWLPPIDLTKLGRDTPMTPTMPADRKQVEDTPIHAALLAAKKNGLRRCYFNNGAPLGLSALYGWYAAATWSEVDGDSSMGGPWTDASIQHLCEAGMLGISRAEPLRARLTRAGKAEIKRAAHQPPAPVKAGGEGA